MPLPAMSRQTKKPREAKWAGYEKHRETYKGDEYLSVVSLKKAYDRASKHKIIANLIADTAHFV